MYDSGQVSFEHLLLSWYPFQRKPAEPTNPESINPHNLQHHPLIRRGIPTLNMIPWTGGELFFFITLKPRGE